VNRSIVGVTVVSVVLVALQLSLLTQLRLSGTVVMVVWLWPMTVGLTGLTVPALVAAVVTGYLFDAHATTPFGLSIAVGVALALGAVRMGREGVGDLDSAAFWVTPALGALAGFTSPLLFVAAGVFAFDFSLWRGSLVATMVVNGIAGIILARPLARLARLAVGSDGRGRR